jgi:tetratricopeptide (TPR) repeat protein
MQGKRLKQSAEIGVGNETYLYGDLCRCMAVSYNPCKGKTKELIMKKKDFLFLAVAAVLAVAGNTAIWGQAEPTTADDFVARGMWYSQNGDDDRAIADCTQAIRLDPNRFDAYFGRGLSYFHKADYDRAIADFTQVIRLTPNTANAYYRRGRAYVGKGDIDRAIADFTQTIQLAPNHFDAYFDRGLLYFHKPDYDRAIADFTQVLRIDPNDADAKRWLDTARQQRGR